MRKISILIYLTLISLLGFGQSEYSPSPDNVKNRVDFQDAKFGLFIHWGVYSLLADGEWVMQNKSIKKNDYEKLPQFFNPTEFDAKEWVKIAKAAGMKYITITTRHHDGFSMFKTQQSPYNIIDATPFKRDVLKELADACRAEGIKLGFYYSHLDWYHNDYFPRGTNANSPGRPNQGDWDNYLKFMNAQLTELLTNYGDIHCIWFDGWWDKTDANWKLDEQYALIHKLQPGCLIGNNHHRAPKAGEDFQMFEKDLPGKNTTGFSEHSKIGDLPLEMCETMNHSWGYNFTDNKYKSSKNLIQTLVKAAGYNSNFLLNVGPMPNGKIQRNNIDSLAVMGKWLAKNGATIYCTRGGPIEAQPWGVTTQKGKTIYLHILDYNGSSFLLPDFKKSIASVKVFASQQSIAFKQNEFGLIFNIPANAKDDIDTIIEITLK